MGTPEDEILRNIQISESGEKSNVDKSITPIGSITVENTLLVHGNIQLEKNLVSGD